jgi:hypothetical protein
MTKFQRWRVFALTASVWLTAGCNSGGGRGTLPDSGNTDTGEPDSDTGSLDSDTGDASLPPFSQITKDRVPGWRLAWAHGFGDGAMDVTQGTAKAGDATLATGLYSSDVVFGEGEPNETTLPGPDDQMFLARYNPDGTLGWAVGTQGWGTYSSRVSVAPDGTAIVVGDYGIWAVFGVGEPNETTFGAPEPPLTAPTHAFIARYASDGALMWVRRARTLSVEQDPEGCDCDLYSCQTQCVGTGVFDDGSAIAAGLFYGKIVFGEGTPAEQSIVSAGDTDGFFARYGADGELAWAKRLGGTGRDGCVTIATLADDTFYMTGHFEGTVVLGEGEPSETSLTATDYTSAFLARYDGDGTLLWARDLGIDGDVNKGTGGIEVLPDGNLIVTGRYRGGMVAGDGEGDEVVVTPAEGRGMFVAKYAPDGARLWNRIAVTAGAISAAWDVRQLHDGKLVVVGDYTGDAVFGMGEPNETILPYGNDAVNAYVALYTAEGKLEWVLGQGGPGNDIFTCVEAYYDEPSGKEWIVVGGTFDEGGAVFGTGGGDEITLQSYNMMDAMVLRFDRESSSK